MLLCSPNFPSFCISETKHIHIICSSVTAVLYNIVIMRANNNSNIHIVVGYCPHTLELFQRWKWQGFIALCLHEIIIEQTFSKYFWNINIYLDFLLQDYVCWIKFVSPYRGNCYKLMSYKGLKYYVGKIWN